MLHVQGVSEEGGGSSQEGSSPPGRGAHPVLSWCKVSSQATVALGRAWRGPATPSQPQLRSEDGLGLGWAEEGALQGQAAGAAGPAVVDASWKQLEQRLG